MKKLLSLPLTLAARHLHGKGIVDRYAPFLLPIYQALYSRLQAEPTKIVSLSNTLKLKVLTHDIGIGLPLILRGSYEPLQTKLFLESIHKGDIVLDIGANIGYYTVLASEKVGKTGRVIAFEPDRDTFQLLQENIQLNALSNVTPEHIALSDKNGTLSFSARQDNIGESGISFDSATTSYKVTSLTLDSYLSKHSVKHLNFVKMDIEGAEVLALLGAKTLSKYKNLHAFIEYNPSSLSHYTKNPEKLLELISSCGLEIVSIVDEQKNSIVPYSYQSLQEILSKTTFCNLFCKSKGLI